MRISHIGSTAVPSVMAKPIVDILVEVRADCLLEIFREPLTRAGYLCMSERAEQLSWNKGYTPQPNGCFTCTCGMRARTTSCIFGIGSG